MAQGVRLTRSRALPSAFQRGQEALYALDYDKARALLEKATAEEPANALAFYELGNAYHQSGRDGDAFDAWTKAGDLDPNLDEVQVALGVYYLSSGKAEDSIQRFDAAIRIDPSPDAYIQRGLAEKAKGDFSASVASWDHALEHAHHPIPEVEHLRSLSIEALRSQPPTKSNPVIGQMEDSKTILRSSTR